LSTRVSPDRAVAKIDTFLGMVAVAREGLGATLLPRLLGEADASLKQLAPASEKAAVDVRILTHPNQEERRAHRGIRPPYLQRCSRPKK
jgi:DNA-binding transcriptional LysR family regulator